MSKEIVCDELVKEQRQVQRQMDRLHERTVDLCNLVDEAESRLSQVLRPAFADEPDTGEREQLVPLADNLAERNDVLQYRTNQLRDILNRLEI